MGGKVSVEEESKRGRAGVETRFHTTPAATLISKCKVVLATRKAQDW